MRARAAWTLVAVAAGGCELQDVTLVDFSEVAVGEVYVMLGPTDNRVLAFIHGSAAGEEGDTETFDDAVVRIGRQDGLVVDLPLGPLDACHDTVTASKIGSCFADGGSAVVLQPGDALDLTITLADGRRLLGALTIPGDFQILGVPSTCRLLPDTLLDVRWTRSSGAWAYVNETSINGLRDALAGEGVEVEDDPLNLLGLSISATDTTVVFPSEFGIFDRFDLDQGLALRLQRGLPEGTDALVTVAAVERNYVNWARGGNFNPSGQVRVASLRGDGTGVFGAAVVRSFSVIASAASGGAPDCPLS